VPRVSLGSELVIPTQRLIFAGSATALAPVCAEVVVVAAGSVGLAGGSAGVVVLVVLGVALCVGLADGDLDGDGDLDADGEGLAVGDAVPVALLAGVLDVLGSVVVESDLLGAGVLAAALGDWVVEFFGSAVVGSEVFEVVVFGSAVVGAVLVAAVLVGAVVFGAAVVGSSVGDADDFGLLLAVAPVDVAERLGVAVVDFVVLGVAVPPGEAEEPDTVAVGVDVVAGVDVVVGVVVGVGVFVGVGVGVDVRVGVGVGVGVGVADRVVAWQDVVFVAAVS